MSRSKKGKTSDGLTLQDFHGGGTSHEKRREPRTRVEKMISIMPVEQDIDAGFYPAQMMDCSPNGICILCDQALAIGDRFLVKLRLHRMLLAVYATRNCRQEKSKFRIGAELTGIVGGVEDEPNAIFKALLGTATQGSSEKK